MTDAKAAAGGSADRTAAARFRVAALGVLLVSVCLVDCWGAAGNTFELRGTIVRSDGTFFSDFSPIVQISGPGSLTSLSTVADSRGRFRFKKVAQGMYLLTAFVPRVARTKRTIEVGPSSADEEGRINIDLKLEPRPRRPERFQVQATQLTVPEKARAEYEKGLRRFAKRDLAGAAECFAEAVDFAPQYAAAWYQLGLVACQQSRFAEAAGHFREAIKHSPQNYQALLSLGAALLAQHDGPEALAVNERAVMARPDDPEAQAQLGISYLSVNRLEEAEIHLKATISLDPANFHYPQLLLAEIYRRRRDYSSMAGQLEEFLRLHPDSQQKHEVAQMLGDVRSHVRNQSAGDAPR